jgi:sentrin-specific protease 1
MASKKYKIAYNKKRSGQAEDIFKCEHTIRTGVPIDLRGYFLRTTFNFFSMIIIVYNIVGQTLFYRLNTSYLVLQAMIMWGG